MKKLFINITAVFMSALIITGCTKKIEEAYPSPNADVKVPVEDLLPPIISCMAANSAGHGPLNDYRFFGKYIQYWSFCNSGDMYDRMSGRLISLGSTQADMTGSIFRMHYYDIGQNLVRMMQWAGEEKKWDYVGVGKAISAWSWLTLTDVQGEVILKDAFDQGKLTFNYDTQEEAYDFVKKECYQALDYLNRTGDGVNPAKLAVSDAYMYGGDITKWKKFVYGILARVHNHVSNKASYKPDSVIYYANLSLSSNADNAMVKFAFQTGGLSASANFFGPVRSNLGSVVDGTNSAIRQSAYIVNLMKGANSAFAGVTDPRAIYMLRKNANNTFMGVSPNKGQGVLAANDRPENFWGVAQTASSAANTAPGSDNNCRYIFRNNAPVPVMTASEIQFLKAEAALRKGDKVTALAAYQLGISLNIDMLANDFATNVPAAEVITPTSKANFLGNTVVVPTDPNNLTLSKIMLQKYIALFGWGVGETWVDMRRYHYTDIDPATGQQVYTDFVAPSGTDLHPGNNNKLVYRTYPRYNSEYVWNVESLKKIGADQTDFHTVECWFSKP